ncbi:Laminin subunit alpha-2 [Chionoecetes opilio]|uniref:Laminin subunit alpha-2 n=1 Tax=Chionoecetes opilio TaxID=41210 RepID=A0A8J5CMU8_CHIOP|nr:Laminin subunit alpha-2 [Chionoecetes opilio]
MRVLCVPGCDCDERGSTSSSCDIVSGQCLCRSNVAGRACDACRAGYWGLSSGSGCRPCDCNPRGSISPQCDDATGQCRCRPGVGGLRCDACLPGYWGFSRQGCKRCDPCGTPGRFCDPTSGRCICPPNTEGDRCERCSPGSWDYHASKGCKPCNCSGVGALSRQCDARTGHCKCKDGNEGERCGRCSHGFYGFPICSPCNCFVGGTNPQNCDGQGRCQCDERGQCPCKANVVGRRCGKCKGGTFGLSVDNPSGCTGCYCFRRTTQCTQADLTWSQLALPGERILSFGSGETRLNRTNHLHMIPGTEGNVSIVSSLLFDAPLYWQLPREFMRDKVKSYNGYLRFRTESEGGRRVFPEQILQTYPLVSLQGNWQLVLEYYPPNLAPDGLYKVKLHEKYWRLKNDPRPVTREMMLVALQNIQHILIRATHASDATAATLQGVTMDIAAAGSPVSSRVAVGVEQCSCPSSYSGTSCQNPNHGHYRWYKENYIVSTIIIDLVGEARRCVCNGRSETCDSETGVCKNCRDNTMGTNCEVCATGYYGNPDLGRCKPCACPSRIQNFAETCQADPYDGYVCNCRTGYTGSKCDRQVAKAIDLCDYGYYGNPYQPGGSCVACRCDPFGSVHEGCDNEACVDGCIDVLLDEVEDMIDEVTSVDMTDIIPAPWPSLREIRNITKVLRHQLNRYHGSVDASQKLIVEFNLDYLARDLLRRAEELVDAARKTYPPTAKIKSDAQAVLNLLNSLYVQIDETVAYLKNYAIGETPSISVGVALEEAEKILKQIQMRNFSGVGEEADTELLKAELLLERIKKMDQTNPLIQDINLRVGDFESKLKELREKIRISNRKTNQAGLLMEGNVERLQRLKDYSEQIRNSHVIIQDQNFNSTQLLRDAERYLRSIGLNYEDIEKLLWQLRNSSSFLSEYEAKLRRENIDYRERYVKRAHDHAMDLMRRSIRLESLFKKTRGIAVGPLNAAEAYQRIVDALLSAEEAARNASQAADKAYLVAYPGQTENSLVRRATQSLRTSEELQSKGRGLKSTVAQQLTDLNKQQLALGSTRGILDSAYSRINALHTLMDTHFTANISSGIQRALRRTEQTHRNVEGTLETVTSIQTNLTIIKEQAKELNRFDSSLLNEIRETISTAKGHTTKGVRLASNMQKTVYRIENQSKDLRDRIEALKRKIKQTRQYASSIRVSLTTDDAGVCTRKYRPTLHPSTTTAVRLSYAVSSADTDALLLYLGSSNASDFMAVEMVNRRIEFVWDAGGGLQRITHPLNLLTNTQQVSDDTRWYHITINRVGNIGQLSVVPSNSEGRSGMIQPPVSDASPPGFSKMDLLPTDTVWVGGAPPRAFSVLKARKFSGCLHTLSIDGENVGLWNFTESEGCGACNEGEELVLKQSDERAAGFNGKGYFKGSSRQQRPKPYYNTVLSFKTLDEDALLFLAVNDATNQYFSIALENGHVVFTVQFDSQTRLVMKSSRRHNNRDMIQIQAIVQNRAKGGARMGRLMVGDQDQLGTVKGGPDLDLSRVPYYFGGVDPEFDRKNISNEVVCWQVGRSAGAAVSAGLHVWPLSLDKGRNPLTDGQYYGIESSCADKPLYDVGFLGQGFVELPSHVLKRDSSFGFTFQTMEADALLMVSTFMGQPLPPGEDRPPDFYSVSLVEGHLDIRLNGGGQSHRMMSAAKFNDGRLHAFFVIKERYRMTLKVDDAEVNTTRLDRTSQVVAGPDTGGLYFGGVPENINIVSWWARPGHSRAACATSSSTTIVSFLRPVRFQEVFIGRCSDLPATAMQGMEADMKVADSCLPPTQHTVEYKALKFGDQMDSHVLVPLQPTTFKKNFEVSFEFRTYYPNGLFFIASKTRRKRVQSIAVRLHNGRVKASMRKDSKKGSKVVEAVSDAGLNTGQWTKVKVQKVKKRITLSIDGKVVKRVKGPRKVNVGRELFLGGLPSGVTGARVSGYQEVEPLRGCLRNLDINGEEYEIPSTRRRDQMVGVGQCFASVQPGSYFPGDAYAIYSDKFNVGLMLELSLEFRTWELTGIILSVADPRGTSLSLELINGAASYIKDSLALRVDDNQEAYGFNGSGDHEGAITGAELFIGGLPDTARQGTLNTRENFKGCIRNIVLNSERRDWTDMYKLQNVLLSACPVQ